MHAQWKRWWWLLNNNNNKLEEENIDINITLRNN
jgi:hypothetical protein